MPDSRRRREVFRVETGLGSSANVYAMVSKIGGYSGRAIGG